jgi:4-hydroxybenzoate polyprenyltransferase
MSDLSLPLIPAGREVLVIDAVGRIESTDSSHAVFWANMRRDWRLGLCWLPGFGQHRQAHRAPSFLPFDPVIADQVAEWRARGGKIVLICDAPADTTSHVAASLGSVDEIILSHDPEADRELLLAGRFAQQGFVRLVPGLARADQGGWRSVLSAVRVHQWIKNVLVFLPMLAAHRFDLTTLTQSVMAFLAFCLVASSVYVMNDLLDLQADRAHRTKRFRPFASGAIALHHGSWMIPVLFLAGLAVSAPLGWRFILVMLCYAMATTAYSLALKQRLVIDICLLAGFYTLRILAGGEATGIALSMWLLAFATFLFLSLAAVKRQAELVDQAAAGLSEAHGRGYEVGDLPIVSAMAIASGYVSVLVMALYLNSPEVGVIYQSPRILWGICPILLYWVSRTVMITHRSRMHDDPAVFALRDGVSQVCLLAVVALVLAGTVF